MKKTLSFLCSAVVLFLAACTDQSSTSQPKDDLDILLSEMSIEEKVGQMTNLTISTIAYEDENGNVKIDSAKLIDAVDKHHIGSFQNVLSHAYTIEEWHSVLNTIQKKTLKYQDVPSLYCIDAIHGMNYTIGSTVFPHNIGMAATRNRELVSEASIITAKECRASGIRYNFDPVLDVGREQQWSRFGETYGEDTYLVQELGVAAIKAYEGKDLTSHEQVASCMKHFIGYGVPRNGKDRAPALIPEVDLREYYLPTFQKAVAVGASTLMVNSGEVNGTPVHASKYLLTDVLREELGFEGVVISDWQDVLKMHERHRVAATHKEAVKLAVDAGIDMVIVPFDYSFYDDLLALVKEGEISEERIDQSVKRILQLKKKLGLFENPMVEKEAIENFGRPEYEEVALKAAEESITLLKNENDILPLDISSSVVLLGPTADRITSLHGAWTYTWQGTQSDYFADDTPSLEAAFSASFENGTYISGIEFEGNDPTSMYGIVEQCKEKDLVLYCLGEEAYAETPGNVPTLDLEDYHTELIKSLKLAGKKVVLVLIEGRPRIIREMEPYCDAVVLAYMPASQGAKAIVNVLTGEVNPSGKLPFTYPRYASERITYDHKLLDEAVEEVSDGYKFGYRFAPQYEFGHGLSYTKFTYDRLELSSDTTTDSLIVKIRITNDGKVKGKEAIDVFVRDFYASITPPVKRLRAFAKIDLDPGQSKLVQIILTKEDLAYVHDDLSRSADAGEFEVIIAKQKAQFYLK